MTNSTSQNQTETSEQEQKDPQDAIREVISKVLRLTQECQVIWEYDYAHSLYVATYKGTALRLDCGDKNPYFAIGQAEIKIGHAAIKMLCQAIGSQWGTLRKKSEADAIEEVNRLQE
jgi:hypothetical protein